MSKRVAAVPQQTEALDLGTPPEELVARLARAAEGGQRVVVRRAGKDVAALVPLEDLRLLEQIRERLEDESDVEYARRMLADPDQTPVPLSEVRARLGL